MHPRFTLPLTAALVAAGALLAPGLLAAAAPATVRMAAPAVPAAADGIALAASDAAAVPWTFVQPDNGPSTDHTEVRLDLPQAVAPGASTTLAIDFLTQLPRIVARTGYFDTFHLVAQWFPKIGRRWARPGRWAPSCWPSWSSSCSVGCAWRACLR